MKISAAIGAALFATSALAALPARAHAQDKPKPRARARARGVLDAPLVILPTHYLRMGDSLNWADQITDQPAVSLRARRRDRVRVQRSRREESVGVPGRDRRDGQAQRAVRARPARDGRAMAALSRTQAPADSSARSASRRSSARSSRCRKADSSCCCRWSSASSRFPAEWSARCSACDLRRRSRKDHLHGGRRQRSAVLVRAGARRESRRPSCRSTWTPESMSEATPVTLIPGDGIGPSIVSATVRIVEAAGAEIEWDRQLAGMAGVNAVGDPMPVATLDSIKRTRLALKGPLETPVGRGLPLVNVALRKRFDLYANVRPAHTIAPERPLQRRRHRPRAREHRGAVRRHRALHQIGNDDPRAAAESIAIITRAGAERIVRYRLRVRGEAQAQEGHARAQGEHPQVLAGALPRHRPHGRQRIRGTDRVRGAHRRRDGDEPRAALPSAST